MSEPTPHQDAYADEDVVGHGPPTLTPEERDQIIDTTGVPPRDA